jgi:alkanesulfonate monooxygenase SsuD/methylene tetrahydromethanopterin reductase-like flavin-dependent oxidoreductase (luciferase family)
LPARRYGPDDAGMSDDVSYGLLLPTREVAAGAGRPDELVPFAVEAERRGFASVWAGEGLTSPRFEPLAVLGAATAVTDRITLGTAALLPAAREPRVTAASLATLDALSGGRLVVGVGAGFPALSRPVFEATGHTYGDRYGRLEATVARWRALWAGDELCRPVRAGGPPVWFAGDTPAGRARTAEAYDGWMPYPPDPADYAGGLAGIRAAGGHAVTPSLYITVVIDDDPARARQAAEDWCAVFYGRPLELIESIQVVVTGPADEVAAGIARFVAAGARHLVVRLGSLDRTGQLERLAEIITNP